MDAILRARDRDPELFRGRVLRHERYRRLAEVRRIATGQKQSLDYPQAIEDIEELTTDFRLLRAAWDTPQPRSVGTADTSAVFLDPRTARRDATPGLVGTAGEHRQLLDALNTGISMYLDTERAAGRHVADETLPAIMGSVREWLESPHIDAYTKRGIQRAIRSKRWEDIAQTHNGRVKFGTAGPRQVAAVTMEELEELHEQGFHAEILKGPNTINNITLAQLTTGVARFFKSQGIERPKVAITYDTRIYGRAFTDLVAATLIKEGAEVYLFDAGAPMPEMSFAVADLRLDMGILVSASHNPALYNGYKVTNRTGAQLDLASKKGVEREIYGGDGAAGVTFADVADIVQRCAAMSEPVGVYEELGPDVEASRGPLVEMYDAAHQEVSRLVILGARDGEDARGRRTINIHDRHADHVVSHVLDPDVVRDEGPTLTSLYSAFYGVGGPAVQRTVVDRLGVKPPIVSSEMNRPDGRFPVLSGRVVDGVADPLIPDPGNSAGNAFPWEVALEQLRREQGNLPQVLRGLDLFSGSDPDADRLGVGATIPASEVPAGLDVLQPVRAKAVPADQQARVAQLIPYVVPEADRAETGYGALKLFSANDTWALLLKYRIDRFAQMQREGRLPDGLRFTIVKTHVSTDALSALAKYGRAQGLDIDMIEPYVGFSLVAEQIKAGWRAGKINLGGAEESGGFSIGGAPTAIYALLHLYETYDEFSIDAGLGSSHPDPLFRRDTVSYFGYTDAELIEALAYLEAEDVLKRTDAKPYAYVLQENYQSRRGQPDYWQRVKPVLEKAPGSRLGKRGHTLEKDGLMALVLSVEVAAYAKSREQSLNEYLQESLYLNPHIGYYATTNQALAFPNTMGGNADKQRIIKGALALARRVKNHEKIMLAGQRVTRAEIFVPRDAKYADPELYPVAEYKDLIPLLGEGVLRDDPSLLDSFFPEEGVRFHFAAGCHLTIRPSGTENKLRFYVQWKSQDATRETLTAHMLDADQTAYAVATAAQGMVSQPAAGVTDARVVVAQAPARESVAESPAELWNQIDPGVASADGQAQQRAERVAAGRAAASANAHEGEARTVLVSEAVDRDSPEFWRAVVTSLESLVEGIPEGALRRDEETGNLELVVWSGSTDAHDPDEVEARTADGRINVPRAMYELASRVVPLKKRVIPLDEPILARGHPTPVDERVRDGRIETVITIPASETYALAFIRAWMSAEAFATAVRQEARNVARRKTESPESRVDLLELAARESKTKYAVVVRMDAEGQGDDTAEARVERRFAAIRAAGVERLSMALVTIATGTTVLAAAQRAVQQTGAPIAAVYASRNDVEQLHSARAAEWRERDDVAATPVQRQQVDYVELSDDTHGSDRIESSVSAFYAVERRERARRMNAGTRGIAAEHGVGMNDSRALTAPTINVDEQYRSTVGDYKAERARAGSA